MSDYESGYKLGRKDAKGIIDRLERELQQARAAIRDADRIMANAEGCGIKVWHGKHREAIERAEKHGG